MKFQSVIFLALLGLMALLSNAEAVPPVSSQQISALIKTQAPCILYGAICDQVGNALKKQLPIILKGCTLEGCTGKSPKIQAFIDIVRKSNATIWEAVIRTYVRHN